VRHHFEDASHGVTRSQNFVYFLFHVLFGVGVGTAQKDFFLARNLLDFLPRNFAIGNRTDPTAITWLRTSTPNSRKNNFANAPIATRAADSRAEARSRT